MTKLDVEVNSKNICAILLVVSDVYWLNRWVIEVLNYVLTRIFAILQLLHPLRVEIWCQSLSSTS